MRRSREAEHALRLATTFSRQPHICRSCRARTIRQFHSSPASPFLQSIRESLFGTTESEEAKKKREEQIKQKTEAGAKRDAARTSLETMTDRRGRKYEVAAIYDPSINPEYVISTNWDGLRRIGGERWIKERADAGEQYVGFAPKKRIQLNEKKWQLLLHHVAVEVLALEAAGGDLENICSPRRLKDKPWRQTSATLIKTDPNTGATSLQFSSDQSRETILSSITEAESELPSSESEPFEDTDDANLEPSNQKAVNPDTASLSLSQELYGATTSTLTNIHNQYKASMPWMDMRLDNTQIKLAIVKRIMQLTGHRIPDPTISKATTLRDLYETMKTKEPPKKLAQAPELKELKATTPNVAVYKSRRTPIHKEIEVGRWKVISDELIARDLPITGSRWVDAKPRTGVKMPKHYNRA